MRTNCRLDRGRENAGCVHLIGSPPLPAGSGRSPGTKSPKARRRDRPHRTASVNEPRINLRERLTMVHRFQVFLLHFVDVDGRVVSGSKRKRQATNNDLHCVASIGRERDLITQGSPNND